MEEAMDLVTCAEPRGALQPAPLTGLRKSTANERWEGFWEDDSYVARCTAADGQVEWFRLEDDGISVASSDPLPVALRITRRDTTLRTRAIMVRNAKDGTPKALLWVKRR